ERVGEAGRFGESPWGFPYAVPANRQVVRVLLRGAIRNVGRSTWLRGARGRPWGRAPTRSSPTCGSRVAVESPDPRAKARRRPRSDTSCDPQISRHQRVSYRSGHDAAPAVGTPAFIVAAHR